MKIIALDPGTRRTGYAVFEPKGQMPQLVEGGVIFVKGEDLPERLLSIHRGIERLFRRHRPRQVAIERPFVGINGASALSLAAARGVCMLAAAVSKAQVFDYSPSEIKKAVSTSGLTGKVGVQRSVQLLLRLRDLPQSDMADAMALAICHLNRTHR